VSLVEVPDVELRSDYMAYRQEAAVVIGRDYHMDYVPEYLETGLGAFGFTFATEVPLVRDAAGPVFVVSHFNMSTYGHFLLEVLPKVLLSRHLIEQGRDIKVAFPATAAYVSEIVREIVPAEQLVEYDSRNVRLRCGSAYFPSFLMSQRYDAHALFVSMLQNLVREIVGRHSAELPPRVFLSRERHLTLRRLTNESRLAAIAAEHGFEVVHPQELPWQEQVCLFAGATHVIGEYSSALHNHMFSPQGTRIMSLGRVNAAIANLAGTLGQPLGYVFASAVESAPVEGSAMDRMNFAIDEDDFARRVEVFVG
jgi:O-antigen biosynthesis protein WbqL